MKNEKNKQFSLSDFYTAAFLRAKNLRLLNIIKTDPHRVLFVFEDKEDRQKLIEDFLFGRTIVEPKSFIAAIKELKQLLYSNYEDSKNKTAATQKSFNLKGRDR